MGNRIVKYRQPQVLAEMCFFLRRKKFCIQGGEEQRQLKPSYFICTSNPDCYTYIERGSKNNSGTSKSFRFENKEVPCPAIPEQQPRCLVFLLDLYLAKLPTYAFEHNVLYLRPKPNTPSDPSTPWYENAPVGKNTLANMVKDLCAEAGIKGKTNHSLRASGATALFQANVPERIIQKVTGNKSLDALCGIIDY